MIDNEEFDFTDFKEICYILNVTTNIDVYLINKDGNCLYQLVNSSLPVVVHSYDNDSFNIITTLKESKLTNYFHYINRFNLEYISVGIWKDNSFHGAISIGPFISYVPTTETISDIISNNKLPITQRKQLIEYYSSLPILDIKKTTAFGSLLVNLCSHSYVYPKLLTQDIIKTNITQNNLTSLTTTIDENKNIIEARYKLEKKIFNAIANGNTDEIMNILKQTTNLFDFTYRIPTDPIRSTKNLALTFNSVLRLAAEKGGVHPVYIHTLSDKFAIMIEKATNLPYLNKLNLIMVDEYCNLVKNFSTRNYSPLIKEVINYINLNLANPLTLKSIATTLHISPSHLSRKFKSDTNMTVIDYINKKRIAEAKLYLERGNLSFTEIALMVGFNDLNYFGRVFRKVSSMTPSEYVKSATF